MKEQKKKRLIASLLLISCFISGYMLFAISGDGSKTLRSTAQADSLIQNVFADFNISEKQIQITTTSIDSNFRRKTYHVGLPYSFSKTQFHAELNSKLHEYSVETPAQVTFPEQDVDIHLTYKGTVFRTISLQTDPDLVAKQSQASILVAFDQLPDDNLLTSLESLGEPIPIVLKIKDPSKVQDFSKQLSNSYNKMMFWLQSENGEDLIRINTSTAIQKLKQIENVMPEAAILQLNNNKIHEQLVRNTDLTFVKVDNILLLHEQLGKASFFEELYKLRTSRKISTAIINGNKTTISWLQEKLPELKKAGVTLISPSATDF